MELKKNLNEEELKKEIIKSIEKLKKLIEEMWVMAGTTVSKNKNGYGYKYTDLAQIHEYLESIGARYYQYIDRIDGDDYIMTVPIVDGKELPARRGVKIVDAVLNGIKNPAQEQGSATTYARRYSLLMAFGLATEDDDAQNLTKPSTSQEKTIKATAKQVEILSKVYTGENLQKLLNANGISKLEDLSIQKASAIIKALNEKKGN